MMHLIKHVKAGGEIPLQLPSNIIPRRITEIARSGSSSSFTSDRKVSVPDSPSSWVVDNRTLETSRANFMKLNPGPDGRVPGSLLAQYFFSICPNQNALKASRNTTVKN